MSKEKPSVKFIGKTSHYVVTKGGGWNRQDKGDSYIFTKTTMGTTGQVTVTVTISRKTGKVTRATSTGCVQGNKIVLNDAIVLNAVNAAGETLARPAVIYNEFKL